MMGSSFPQQIALMPIDLFSVKEPRALEDQNSSHKQTTLSVTGGYGDFATDVRNAGAPIDSRTRSAFAE